MQSYTKLCSSGVLQYCTAREGRDAKQCRVRCPLSSCPPLPSRSHPALQCPLTAAPAPHCPIHCSVLSGLRLTRCPHAQRIHFALAMQWHRLLNGIIEDLKSRSVDQQVGRRTLSICNSPPQNWTEFHTKGRTQCTGQSENKLREIGFLLSKKL